MMDKDKLAETAAEAEMRLRKFAADASTSVTSSEQYSQWKSLSSERRFLIGGAVVVAAFLLLAWLLWPGKAAAQECKPDIPDDAQIVCVGGKLNVYSPSANQRMEFPMPCGRQA